ncbi:hypothetical protein [Neobacillus sp. PS3-40]|uniref:hypothetical protein n=1 Tax=Neobacillus sp. PS3-40 TaxID=3070679 RepID=UPI0027E0B6CC|nr:hypothetical protein [Neobacillus sp. PS3-40]WML42701.1 hypothetical protein RCG20_12705 [Neobacillus sp. PS3-40]
MNINTWSQISKLKANLLELADVLLSDEIMSKEEIAFDLICNVQTLTNIEGDVIKSFRNNKMRKLHQTCEEKEIERENKRPSLKTSESQK